MGIRSTTNIKLVRRQAGPAIPPASHAEPAKVEPAVDDSYFGSEINSLLPGSVKQINRIYDKCFPKEVVGGVKEIENAFNLQRIKTQVATGLTGNVYMFPEQFKDDVYFANARDHVLEIFKEIEENPKKGRDVVLSMRNNSRDGDLEVPFGRYKIRITVTNTGQFLRAEISDQNGYSHNASFEMRTNGVPSVSVYPTIFKGEVQSKAIKLFCKGIYADNKLLRELLKISGALPLEVKKHGHKI